MALRYAAAICQTQALRLQAAEADFSSVDSIAAALKGSDVVVSAVGVFQCVRAKLPASLLNSSFGCRVNRLRWLKRQRRLASSGLCRLSLAWTSAASSELTEIVSESSTPDC